MSLRTSLFNKSILKSDIRRFWWTALLETLFIFGVSVVPVWESCKRAGISGGINNVRMGMPSWIYGGSIVLLILFALGVGVGLFTYMHFSASVSMHHSIPVKRKTILFTKLLGGTLLTVIPIIINAIIFVLMLIDPLFRDFYSITDVFNWLITGVLYTVLILTLTTVVNMMTGNPVGTIIFTVGFALLPVLICTFLEYFFYTELYGYTGNTTSVLSKIYIFEDKLATFPYYLVYIVLIAVFVFGAYILYQKRKLENHGEVIAFSWLKPVFIAVIAVLASMVSYAYFRGVMNIQNILALIPLGILGTVIAWMIARKSLSLRGVLKPVVIYLVCSLAFCAVIHFDLTGFENRIPDIEDVAKVQLTDDKISEHSHTIDNEYVTYSEDGRVDRYFSSKTDIKNVMELHQYLISQKDSDEIRSNAIPLTYTLKNGKVINRVYNVDLKLDREYLKPVYETPQMKAERFGLVNGIEKEFQSLTVQDRRINSGVEVCFYPDNKDMQKIIDAIRMDIEELKYEEFEENDGASTVVNVVYKNKYRTNKGTYEYDKICTTTDTYCIRNSYKRTKAVLKEIGFYDTLPTDADISNATVSTWDASLNWNDAEFEQHKTEVTDSEEIKMLYSFYDKMIETSNYSAYEECKNIEIKYTLKNGAEFTVSCSYGQDMIPVELKKYFD